MSQAVRRGKFQAQGLFGNKVHFSTPGCRHSSQERKGQGPGMGVAGLR